MHFKILQFLVETYDKGFLRCVIDVVQMVEVYYVPTSTKLHEAYAKFRENKSLEI